MCIVSAHLSIKKGFFSRGKSLIILKAFIKSRNMFNSLINHLIKRCQLNRQETFLLDFMNHKLLSVSRNVPTRFCKTYTLILFSIYIQLYTSHYRVNWLQVQGLNDCIFPGFLFLIIESITLRCHEYFTLLKAIQKRKARMEFSCQHS